MVSVIPGRPERPARLWGLIPARAGTVDTRYIKCWHCGWQNFSAMSEPLAALIVRLSP
jgi:hypothetical protein